MTSSNEPQKFKSIEELVFDNQAILRLPTDPNHEKTQREVKNACFSLVEPTPVKNPRTVVWSAPALSLLDLNAEEETKNPSFPLYFSGNRLIPGSRPAAHCYCGHQFGYFSGQLGDGATMYLGEVINSNNERWEIQFKGAGKTPYSRTADGRKVLRSSLREFLCSEAMHHLGIPTTRAASVVTSDTLVVRDIYYSGDPIEERATIIMRIARSFIRFGSFEICRSTDPMTHRAGPNPDDPSLLFSLLHYCVDQFYPEIANQISADESAKRAEAMFFSVVRKTARLVAKWQCFGFCHGVLNTDNMSILGDTIDYGPFGFLEFYDENFICNSSDDGGRYTYAAQPEICRWNCNVLADSLSPIVSIDRRKLDLIFSEEYDSEYYTMMCRKLGIILDDPRHHHHHHDVIKSLLKTFQETYNDWTNTFRILMYFRVSRNADNADEIVPLLVDQTIPLSLLKSRLKPRIPLQSLQQLIVLPPAVLQTLNVPLELLRSEMKKYETYETYNKLTDDAFRSAAAAAWRAFLSIYSSSLRSQFYSSDRHNSNNNNNNNNGDDDQKTINEDDNNKCGEGGEEEEERIAEERRKERVEMMRRSNPKYILRNWIAQHVIDEAEKGNFEEAHNVLKLLSEPFALSESMNDIAGGDNVYANAMQKEVKNVERNVDSGNGSGSCSVGGDRFVRLGSKEIRVT